MDKRLSVLVNDLDSTRKHLKGQRRRTAEHAYRLAKNSNTMQQLYLNLEEKGNLLTNKMVKVKLNNQTNGVKNFSTEDKKRWKKRYSNSLLTKILD